MNFVILGAQKSGSTFVHTCVREHPEVFMPSREVHFFEDPIYDEGRLDELDRLFEGTTKKAVGIKRPQYLSLPECAERIFRYCPHARLVVVLRNPVERAVSAYYHYMFYGMLPVRNIEDGMREVIEGSAGAGGREVIEFGFYHRHLQRYLKYFDRELLKVLLFDDIRKDALAAVQDVYMFLGVDPTYEPVAIGTKPQAVLYSMPRMRLRTLRNPLVYTYDAKRTRSYPREPGPLGRFVNRAVLSIDGRILRPLCSNQKPVLSSSLKEKLRNIYREDVCDLEALLNRDLSEWKA